MKFHITKFNNDCSIKYSKKFESPNQETAEFFTLLESRVIEKGESVRLYKELDEFNSVMIIEIER